MEYVYRTQGTCSTNIELNVEDGVVKEVAFWGGCNGNLQGLSRLVKGMKVEEVIKTEVSLYKIYTGLRQFILPEVFYCAVPFPICRYFEPKSTFGRYL